MKRKIIEIDQEKCDGCGLCLPACPEGALQLRDGKARLLSDSFCDGLGACLGHCPRGAITVKEREAEPYDERKVIANIIQQGPRVIREHLKHLKEHAEHDYLAQAAAVLKASGIENPLNGETKHMTRAAAHRGCPGSQSASFVAPPQPGANEAGPRPSQLTHWPIQLHLLSPTAPQYRGRDVLLAADCVAFAVGDFHKEHLQGRSLAIACPKLDDGQEVYVEKLRAMMDDAKINTLTVMIMQVPCCRGLLNLAQEAVAQAKHKVPLKTVVVGLRGEIVQAERV
ncbi:MAG: 4Fe-4S binding protein [Verrucomicrobiae bacterium]|nr:4Fe-4S binding protein [Verrucomicrobiae bacterium]